MSMFSNLVSCNICCERFKQPMGLPCLCQDCLLSYENKTENAAVATKFCFKHIDKPLDIFCVDHSAAICGLCLLNEHRKCDNVAELETIVNKRKATENEIANQLRTTRIEMEQIQRNQDERGATFLKKLEEIRQEVRQIRNQIHQHLSFLEDEILEEVGNIELENTRKVRKEATLTENWMSRLIQNQIILEKELPCVHGTEYIGRFESLSQSTNDLLDSVTNHGTSQNKEEAVFTMDYWISKFLTECKTFGRVTTTVSRNNSTDGPKTSNQTHLDEQIAANTKVNS